MFHHARRQQLWEVRTGALLAMDKNKVSHPGLRVKDAVSFSVSSNEDIREMNSVRHRRKIAALEDSIGRDVMDRWMFPTVG